MMGCLIVFILQVILRQVQCNRAITAIGLVCLERMFCCLQPRMWLGTLEVE